MTLRALFTLALTAFLALLFIRPKKIPSGAGGLVFVLLRVLPKLFSAMSEMAALHPDANCEDLDDDQDDLLDLDSLRARVGTGAPASFLSV